MKRIIPYSILFALCLSVYFKKAQSSEIFFCDNKDIEKFAIQQNGRVKPLLVHAKESFKWLTGSSKFGDYSAVQAYCLLSLKPIGVKSTLKLSAKIEHPELRSFLELDNGKNKAELDSFLTEDWIKKIRLKTMRIKEETSFKKSLSKFSSKLAFYQNVIEGENWLIPILQNDNTFSWVSLIEFLGKRESYEISPQRMTDIFKNLKEKNNVWERINGDTHVVEYNYVKMKLPIVTLILTFLALFSLVLFKNINLGLILSALTVIVQTAILVFRVYISGRAPITNMYETVLFSGYGALVLAMIVGHFKREKVFVLAGLAYNLCSLMMLNFANGMLSASIGPLVPVLRDNFWLSTHVTTIILSYGALALSWVLSNIALFKNSFLTIDNKEYNDYVQLTYTCQKYGVVLLAAGIILGGVWADYSWGRFWGWDPKETWSLIVLCIYIAILHGKYTNWINNKRFIPLTAAAFMSVMMAWFGVNYILASGLHSYGFSEGGAIFLGSFFTIQTLFLLLTLKKQPIIK